MKKLTKKQRGEYYLMWAKQVLDITELVKPYGYGTIHFPEARLFEVSAFGNIALTQQERSIALLFCYEMCK